MKKRLISLALLAAVVLSCWTVTAAAAYTPKYTAYADALYELGLFQGAGTLPSGKPDYRLDRTITRAESIVMLLRLLGESDEAASAKDTTPFTDIKGHWAASYIAYAYEKGYTNGTSATDFSPNRAASGKMYLTYLLRALGYDDGAGDFSYNTAHETAARLGLCAEGAYGSGTFYRDDCVYTSYQALRCRAKDGGEALIYRLTDDKTADELRDSAEPGVLEAPCRASGGERWTTITWKCGSPGRRIPRSWPIISRMTGPRATGPLPATM